MKSEISKMKFYIPDPKLTKEIIELGGDSLLVCYQCGSCTAVCPLSEEYNVSFRKTIKYAQLGLKEKLLSDLTPWICNSCGECNRTCPRNANATSLIAAIRRYLINTYSWGKIGKIFSSTFGGLLSLLVLSILFILGVYIYHGVINLDRIDLLAFIPKTLIHDFGIVLGVFVLGSALLNLSIMFRFVKRGLPTNPINIHTTFGERIRVWISSFFKTLLGDVLYQRLVSKCGDLRRFLAHMALFWGFLLDLISTTFVYLVDLGIVFVSISFMRSIAKIFGVLGGFLLLYGSIYFIWKRVEGKEEFAKKTHSTDWILLILLLLISLTGLSTTFLTYAYNLGYSGEFIAIAIYTLFAAHLLFTFNFLVIAPFSKFAHVGYRAFALWIANTYKKLLEKEAKVL